MTDGEVTGPALNLEVLREQFGIVERSVAAVKTELEKANRVADGEHLALRLALSDLVHESQWLRQLVNDSLGFTEVDNDFMAKANEILRREQDVSGDS